MQQKVGIIGLGAIGSVISTTLLSNDVNELSYFTRTTKKFIKIEFNDERTSIPIVCNLNLDTQTYFDWIIICLKAHQFDSAGHLFKSLITSDTKIAIIRNGINLIQDMEPYSSPDYMLPCIIDCPTQPKDDGYYWQLKHPVITTRQSSLADEFTQLFLPADMTIHQVEDFKTACWKKLIESSALGSIQCLTGQSCHIFEDEKILELYKQLVQEGILVAQAEGAKINANFVDQLLLKIREYPKEKGSSMLNDRLRGNQIELEAKNGAISKYAERYGIATPMNDIFCALIEKVNNKK